MRFFFFIALCFMLTSCKDAFDIHPYDVRFDGQRSINANNIMHIETMFKDYDTLRVAFVSDTHGWYSDTKDMVSSIRLRPDIDFVMHLGDLTDCGTTHEYVWIRDILAGIPVPYVAVIGNHDFLGTGDQVFQKMYGKNDYTFIAGRVKFVCLNTNATEYDYLAAVPNLDFMEEEIRTDTSLFDRTVVCMHARPYSDQFNNNVAKVFQHYVTSFPGLLFCAFGHNHRREADDIYGDGVMYYGVDCAENRNYMVFTITPNDYDYEIVYY
jgi:predicted phosphodiesterase